MNRNILRLVRTVKKDLRGASKGFKKDFKEDLKKVYLNIQEHPREIINICLDTYITIITQNLATLLDKYQANFKLGIFLDSLESGSYSDFVPLVHKTLCVTEDKFNEKEHLLISSLCTKYLSLVVVDTVYAMLEKTQSPQVANEYIFSIPCLLNVDSNIEQMFA